MKTTDFESYLLKKKKLKTTTVETYLKMFTRYQNWVELENLNLTEITYNDLLAYVRYCLDNNQSKQTVNHNLSMIRHYYHYLISINEVQDNPAQGLFIQGVTRRLPHNLLEEKTLQQIYELYPTQSIKEKRNKIVLGLLIYQGITAHEVKLLQPEHLKLMEGKIYIPGTRRSNARELPLMAHQVLQIQHYINEVRPLILAYTEKETTQLITSMGKGNSIANLLTRIVKDVQKYEPKLTAIKQIRTSVLTVWLEKFNLRQVQYMAGHRYVSSTERYQLSSLEDLKKDVNNFHPF